MISVKKSTSIRNHGLKNSNPFIFLNKISKRNRNPEMRTLLILLLACVTMSWALTAREDADLRKKCATKVCSGVDRKELRACLRQCYLEQHSLKGSIRKVLPHVKSNHVKTNFEKQMDANAAKLQAILASGTHGFKNSPGHPMPGVQIQKKKK